jgi:hypothetical protein
MPVARAHVSRTGNEVASQLHPHDLFAPCKAGWFGRARREIFVLATCSLQFAKVGSAATLSQQEKGNFADVQRG